MIIMKKVYIMGALYGFFGGIGFFSLINYVFLYYNDPNNRYPRFTPFCRIVTLICVCICLALPYFNIKFIEKAKLKYLKTFLIELAVAVVTFIPSFFAWLYLIEYVKKFI